ncbi:MAG: hypothetical protein NZ528_04115 [Caldilineales bacterium]|nr:hypothetical protein [Caldilineales bacterium]MDW8319154.1 hypothetical protein [Anaerolineae bacterium]
MTEPQGIESAARFERARRKAILDDLIGLIRGRSPDLLSFEAVQAALSARQQIESRTPETIPLDKIVGSVGRYRDFTREFLPRESVNPQRWKAIDAMLHAQAGLPPIEVYQVGDVYFVRDGHHRVSVARANGLKEIEAYVTRIETPVPLTKDTRPEDLVLKAAYANFLRQTKLDQLRPDVDLEVTEPGSYDELIQHIMVHRHYLGLEQQREIPWEEAVTSWYDKVYLPVAAAIWASDIMEQFPNRTAADLYLWVCRHREEIAAETGEVPPPVVAVSTLAEEKAAEKEGPARVVQTVKRALTSPKTDDLTAAAAKNLSEK